MAKKPPARNLSGLTHEEKDILILTLQARLDALESKQLDTYPIRCLVAEQLHPV